MKVRVRELFVGDLIDHLESFQIAAIELGRELRARRNKMGLVNTDGLATSVQELFQLIRSKDSYIGTTRATRILRHRAKPVWGLDPSADRPDLENAIAWVDTVEENLDRELQLVDSKRVLWMTLFSAVCAAVAAVFAVIAVILGILTLLQSAR
jgi:hypothetical protein